jgi:hypothetical protein
VTRIDVSNTSVPHPGPLQALAVTAGLSLLLGYFLTIPLGLLWWGVGLLAPELTPPRVAEAWGLSEQVLLWAHIAPLLSLGVFALLWTATVREGRKLAPHYGVPASDLSRSLRRFQRRLRRAQPARIWGALNIAAVFVLFSAPLLLPRGVASAPIEFLPSHLRDLGVGVLVVMFFSVIIVLTINGARLIDRRSTAARFFSALALKSAPYLAGAACLLIGMAIGAPFLFERSPIAVLAMIGGGVVGAACMIALDRRIRDGAEARMLATAEDALWADRSRPVLFLRSFKDDAQYVDVADDVDEPLIDRFENILAEAARPYGPVIAVGKPGTLPTDGAARAYYAGDNWREAVIRWMDQALFILMVVGYTKGVEWELDTAILRGHAQKLVLVFPPQDRFFDARWDWMCARFGQRPLGAQLAKADRRGAIALHANRDGELVVFASTSKVGAHYKAALTLALFGKFGGDRRLCVPSPW